MEPMRTTASRRADGERIAALGRCVVFVLAISRLDGVPDSGAAQLEAIHRWTDARGFERLGDLHALKAAQADRATATALFLALTAEEWPVGLVPVFEIEGTNGFELRRLPPVGRENNTEPVFLALPLPDELDTTRIAGRWTCTATRPNGSDAWFAWDLTMLDDRVAGRFDSQSEFRVARLAGGVFRTNQIELVVEYAGESYALIGSWRDGKMRGQWRRKDDSESGAWQATRPPETYPRVPDTEAVPLHEWRHPVDGTRRYTISTKAPGAGWLRTPRPICRVWKPAPATSPGQREPAPKN